MPSSPVERYDFFLSRRGSVAPIAREVENALDEKGYRVLTQDYDIPLGASNEAPPVHHAARRRGGGVAARGQRAAASEARARRHYRRRAHLESLSARAARPGLRRGSDHSLRISNGPGRTRAARCGRDGVSPRPSGCPRGIRHGARQTLRPCAHPSCCSPSWNAVSDACTSGSLSPSVSSTPTLVPWEKSAVFCDDVAAQRVQV